MAHEYFKKKFEMYRIQIVIIKIIKILLIINL